MLRNMIDTPFEAARRAKQGLPLVPPEFPRLWPATFGDSLLKCLAHTDINVVSGGVTALYQVTQK